MTGLLASCEGNPWAAAMLGSVGIIAVFWFLGTLLKAVIQDDNERRNP